MQEVTNRLDHSQQKDFPYFRRTWNKIVVVLLAASFIPLIIIGVGMYHYAASALRENSLESLRLEVINNKKAVDQFLAERVTDLRLLSQNPGLTPLARPGALKSVFETLQSAYGGPCFVDLGIINDQGRHLAYVGPYRAPSKNYKDTEWFKAVIKRGVYVSDVFLGFREEPHFTVAVRHVGNQGVRIIRATIDAAYFNGIVSEVIGKRTGDAYLINRDGIFQTRPRMAGKLMGQSEFRNIQHFEGVRLKERQGQLRATVWLENAPWLCVVKLDEAEIFTALRRMRNVGIAVFVLGGGLIVLTVLLTTNYLVSRLETKRRSIRFLDRQLRQTTKMASSMEVFHEINDPLANIDIEASWIQDLMQKDLTQEKNLKEIRASLSHIKSEVMRGRKISDKLLRVTRHTGPIIREISINDVLDDVLELLDRELHFNNISVKRDYQDDLSPVRSDPSQVHQVFQNLIINAMNAIQRNGEIILTTRMSEDGVQATVTDDGPGIREENIEQVFEPFFTTRPGGRGTGLGLSICRSILERLGGRISVRSEPGKGASFTVELPWQVKGG